MCEINENVFFWLSLKNMKRFVDPRSLLQGSSTGQIVR